MKRLFIGLLLTVVVLAGCQSQATPLPPAANDLIPTPAPTLTEAPTVAPTEAQTAPDTPTSTPKLAKGAEGLGDPFYPQMGNGGYDVLHYTIDLTVNVEENNIAGSTTIEARATEDLDSFNLDFHGLEISEVTVNGSAAGYAREGDELIIAPAEPLDMGEALTVTVTYGGVPEPIADAGVPFTRVGWLHFPQGVFVVSEPSGAKSWYPVNNHPTDKATYSYRITVDKPYVVAANGLLEEEIDLGDARTFVWQSDDPMASYLAAVYISDFDRVTEEGPDGLPIRNYYPPEAGTDMTSPFAATSDMIAFFSELWGPYPFDAYGVVVLGESLFFALESQTLSFFSVGALSESIAAHEVAHQWWGNSVTPASWQDIWLNEGFARYAEALWTEHRSGGEALEGWATWLYQSVQDQGPPGRPSPYDLFDSAVYDRGAWTLHALRIEVGDEAFFDLLRTYYDRHKYGNASTADFIAVAEEVAGRDLDQFFDAWLYTRQTPPMPES